MVETVDDIARIVDEVMRWPRRTGPLEPLLAKLHEPGRTDPCVDAALTAMGHLSYTNIFLQNLKIALAITPNTVPNTTTTGLLIVDCFHDAEVVFRRHSILDNFVQGKDIGVGQRSEEYFAKLVREYDPVKYREKETQRIWRARAGRDIQRIGRSSRIVR